MAVDLQRAVARVAFAARRLHGEEGVAADRDVERIAGLLHRALGEVEPGRAVLHEADAAVVAAKLVRARDRHQVFVEDDVVGLEAGGVQVRDVVRDDVELALKRDLPRQSDERVRSPSVKLPMCDADQPSQASSGLAVPLASPKAGGTQAGFAGVVPTLKIMVNQSFKLKSRRSARRAESAAMSGATRQFFPSRKAIVNHSEPSLAATDQARSGMRSRARRGRREWRRQRQAEAEAEAPDERRRRRRSAEEEASSPRSSSSWRRPACWSLGGGGGGA